MSKVTKKQLQRAIQRQESRIDGLVGLLAKKGYYDKESEPQLKQLDHSVFDGLDEKWQFAAVDANGEANLYTRRMTPDSVEFTYYEGFYFDCETIGTDYDASNWQNSLIERKPELTGSDLCRAMLERGDKYVLCFVSDFSDDYAVNQSKMINLVTHTKGNSIFAKSARWKYAVPINQQTGKPLTAAEVGL